jgi:3-hydroxymyristoyl/3-hydroxydecanoyl-(acyl carrier protein) dehydratase
MTGLEVLDERRDDGRCRRTARIPRAAGWLDGHFPGCPIVPGFVQVGWAIDTARALGDGSRLRRIEGLKFKEILRPGEVIVLTVERASGGVRFALERDGTLASTGRLVFEPASP